MNYMVAVHGTASSTIDIVATALGPPRYAGSCLMKRHHTTMCGDNPNLRQTLHDLRWHQSNSTCCASKQRDSSRLSEREHSLGDNVDLSFRKPSLERADEDFVLIRVRGQDDVLDWGVELFHQIYAFPASMGSRFLCCKLAD